MLVLEHLVYYLALLIMIGNCAKVVVIEEAFGAQLQQPLALMVLVEHGTEGIFLLREQQGRACARGEEGELLVLTY